MSTAAISYSSLKSAASEAKSVAKKLDSYASGLNSSVYKKLTSYSGSSTSNLSTAKSKVSRKISSLEERADVFTAYANDLSELCSQCQTTDKAVKSRVSQLTADFKTVYGIANNPVLNGISYLLTSIENSTFVGRWISNLTDDVATLFDYVKESLDNWWDYGGGSELVLGGAKAALSVFLGVFAIVTGTGGVLGILAIVGGVITAVNGMVDFANELRAYYSTSVEGDPAYASRLSGEESVQDYLRTETDSSVLHALATGLDFVKLICDVGGLLKGFGELLKKGYKWAAQSYANLDDLKVSNILTGSDQSLWSSFKNLFQGGFANFGANLKTAIQGSGVTTIFSSIKTSVASGVADFVSSLKTSGLNALGGTLKSLFSDFGASFLKNFSRDFLDFGSSDTVKNWASLAKGLLSDDGFVAAFGSSNSTLWEKATSVLFANTVLNTFVWTNLNLADTYSFTGSMLEEGHINVKDLLGQFSSLSKLGDSVSSLFSVFIGEGNVFSAELMEKLSELSEIDISVPEIYMPSISIDLDLTFGAAA